VLCSTSVVQDFIRNFLFLTILPLCAIHHNYDTHIFQDEDCSGDLVCFQRCGYTPVRDCVGIGTRSADYCTTAFPPLTTPDPTGQLLGVCEGNCIDDADCAGSLHCFLRCDFEPVPGTHVKRIVLLWLLFATRFQLSAKADHSCFFLTYYRMFWHRRVCPGILLGQRRL